MILITRLVILRVIFSMGAGGWGVCSRRGYRGRLIIVRFLYFLSDKIIFFYCMFEVSLIPISFLIFAGGYQPERLGAVVRIFFYTIGGSLPLLGVI